MPSTYSERGPSDRGPSDRKKPRGLEPPRLVTADSNARQLATSERPSLSRQIKSRIEKRLGGRIRDLRVKVDGKKIILEGRCATYYSKQLAQHAALGVIEDEQVENAIDVTIAN